MVAAFQTPLGADDIKARARKLDADLVGIADGAEMDANRCDATGAVQRVARLRAE